MFRGSVFSEWRGATLLSKSGVSEETKLKFTSSSRSSHDTLLSRCNIKNYLYHFFMGLNRGNILIMKTKSHQAVLCGIGFDLTYTFISWLQSDMLIFSPSTSATSSRQQNSWLSHKLLTTEPYLTTVQVDKQRLQETAVNCKKIMNSNERS
jgi:hypothetical protein